MREDDLAVRCPRCDVEIWVLDSCPACGLTRYEMVNPPFRPPFGPFSRSDGWRGYRSSGGAHG